MSDGTTLYSRANLARVERAYPFVIVVATVALYTGLWAARRRRPDPWADVAVLLVWMTVASPRAWTFNFAAELPAAVLLASAAVTGRRPWAAGVAFAAVLFAQAFDTNHLRLPDHWTEWYVALRDKHFAAAAVLATATAFVAGGDKRPICSN